MERKKAQAAAPTTLESCGKFGRPHRLGPLPSFVWPPLQGRCPASGDSRSAVQAGFEGSLIVPAPSPDATRAFVDRLDPGPPLQWPPELRQPPVSGIKGVLGRSRVRVGTGSGREIKVVVAPAWRSRNQG